MKKLKNIIIAIAVTAYGAALVIFAKEVAEGVKASVSSCLNVIIPSLFAFMVTSGFIISSGFYKTLSRPFAPIARHIFRIPPELFSIFLISCIAGYPIGAKMLADLYESGHADKKTAEKMLCFCYMGGPAFFCGIAGLGIYSNVKTGLVIFLCIFLSNVTIGLIFRPKRLESTTVSKSIEPDFSASALISSICGGGVGILKICGAIIFFSTITAVLGASGALEAAAAFISRLSGISKSDCLCLISSALEISCIGRLSPDIRLLPLATALLSFGGLCVMLQVEGAVSGRLSTNIFYISRIISIFISYFYCKIVICFFGIEKIIQTNAITSIGYRQTSPMPSIFLLIMTILLLSNNYIAKKIKV